MPPIYDRAALALSADERAALEAEGRSRIGGSSSSRGVVRWTTRARREPYRLRLAVRSRAHREDGTYLYTLPSVVDDIDLGVTHVIRGEDHVTNTAVHIQIFEALGGAAPVFGHHNLLTDAGGEGLSKRTGALSIRSLRDSGVEALAVAALAVLVGSADAVIRSPRWPSSPRFSTSQHFARRGALRRSGAAAALSARMLHHLPFAAVRERLAALGVAGRGRAVLDRRCAAISLRSTKRPTGGASFMADRAARRRRGFCRGGGVPADEPWDDSPGALGRPASSATGRKGRASSTRCGWL